MATALAATQHPSEKGTCWMGLSKSFGFKHSSTPHFFASSNFAGLMSIP